MLHVDFFHLGNCKLTVIEEYPTFAVYDEDGTLVLFVRRHILADQPDKYTLIHCAMCIDKYRTWNRGQLLSSVQDYLFGMECVEVFKTEHILIPSLTFSSGMLSLMGLPSDVCKK